MEEQKTDNNHEHFFIPAPTPTEDPHVYLNAAGQPLKWSANFPLPAVGQRIYARLNRIGWAVVKGYFTSAGYVGVMTLPTKPPRWLSDQRKRDIKSGRTMPEWVKQGIGCEFGAEIALQRPKPIQKQEGPCLTTKTTTP